MLLLSHPKRRYNNVALSLSQLEKKDHFSHDLIAIENLKFDNVTIFSEILNQSVD